MTLALLSLGACEEERRVSVNQAGGEVEILVQDREGKDDCIYTVEIYESSRPRDIVWGVELTDGSQCRGRIKVNELPPGYSLASGSSGLQAGREYTIFVSGPGYQRTTALSF